MSDTSVTGARPLSLLLKMAVMAGVESAVRIHIQRGDDLNARDSNGLTPLMLSANRNRPTICKLLLDAGADDSLFDPSGKTALAIALAAGAQEAAVVLESATVARGSEHRVPIVPLHSDDPIVRRSAQTTEKTTDPIAVNAIEADKEAPTAQVEAVEVQQPQDMLDFDLFGWEPEEDRLPPDADSSIAEAATAIQSAITGYEPFDSSADWEDIDAYLPERSLPLARTDDAESRERLRLLLLRAVREGSVPHMEVEALSLNEDRSANPEAELLLSMVVNDLGAEVDERFEYASAHENFEVFVKPEATLDEEEIVENSLAFIVSLASHGTEPLRIYQKEFQRERLISAQDEVLLGQTMESGLEKALDALAAWPRGIGLTLAAGYLVKSGQQPLSWISLGPVGPRPDLELVVDGESAADAMIHDLSDEQVEPNGDSQFDIIQPPGDLDADFSEALGILTSLPASSVQQGTDWHAIRATLSSLRLNRRFLLKLADVANDGDAASAAQFVEAMMLHQRAREQMTVANLKLVFHLAKKYLYSGEPLDDLVQEGNIGLLKAVERFDWRRGFKFSTYATWWIRQQIGRHIADKCKTVRVPVHVHEKAQRLFREIQALELETGRAPKLDEIAVRVDMPMHKVAALQRLALEPLAIHELHIDEMIAIEARSDFVSPDPMDIVFKSELLGTIDKLLSTLTPKEEQILRLRLGIGVEDALTLEEVGCKYEVTRERVRQIEAKAIRKLKHPSRIDAFAHAVFGGPPPTNREEEESRSDPERAEQSLAAELMSLDIPTKGTPASLGVARPAKSSSIDRLLSQAVESGIDIDDDREGISGRLWVNVTEAADISSRRLVRKLIDLGFEYCQGKGYWK
jgi:RNA polymerase primary sigma factor